MNVLGEQPNHPEALAALGGYYVSIGQPARAEQQFQRVLAIKPGQQTVAVALADVYSAANEIEKARGVLVNSAAANQGNPMAWLALGRLEEEQGNAEGAESAYRNAVKTEDSAETNLRLAQFLLRTAKIKEAEEALSRADSKKPLQSTWMADFELTSGHSVRAAIQYLAVLQNRLAKRQEPDAQQTAAIAARVIEADLETARGFSLPENPATGNLEGRTALARLHLDAYRSKVDPATVQILEAEIAMVEGDVARATLLANGAISKAPDSAPAYFVLGELYKSKGDEAAALAEWNSALAADSGYTPALLALAGAEYRQQQFEAAEQKVAAVVRQEPANLGALLLYARILAAKAEYDAARSIAGRAMAVAPQSASPHVVLGEIEIKLSEPGAALAEFQQAILLDEHSQEALAGLIAVYRHGVVTRKMIEKLERAGTAIPPSSALLEIAGRLYADHHLYAEAARCFTRSLEIDRQRASAALALAENTAIQQKDHALDQLASVAASLKGSAQELLDGVKAQDESRPEQAITSYELAIRRGEYTGVAANNLAWLYAERKSNLDRALELAKFAHDRNPRNPAVLDTLGYVYLARREYSQAVAVLKDALTQTESRSPMPLDQEIRNSLREHLAVAYAGVGEQPIKSTVH